MLNFFQWSNLLGLIPIESATLANVLEFLKTGKLCPRDTDIVFVETTEELIPLDTPIKLVDVNPDEVVVCGTKEDYLRFLKRKQDQIQAQYLVKGSTEDSSSFLAKKLQDLGIAFDDFGKTPANNFKRHSMKERQKRIHRFILHSPHPYALPHPNETFQLRHPGAPFQQKHQLSTKFLSSNSLEAMNCSSTIQVPCRVQNSTSALPKYHFLNPANDWVSQMNFEPTITHNSIPFTVSPTARRRTSM